MRTFAFLMAVALAPAPAAADIRLFPFEAPSACEDFPDCARGNLTSLRYYLLSAVRFARYCEERFPEYVIRAEFLHQEFLDYVNLAFGEEMLTVLLSIDPVGSAGSLGDYCRQHDLETLESIVNYAIGSSSRFFTSVPEVWPIERHQVSDPDLLTHFCLSPSCIESRGDD